MVLRSGDQICFRSIGASNYLGTHVEEHYAQNDMWYIARGEAPCMRTLGEQTTMEEGALG